MPDQPLSPGVRDLLSAVLDALYGDTAPGALIVRGALVAVLSPEWPAAPEIAAETIRDMTAGK